MGPVLLFAGATTLWEVSRNGVPSALSSEDLRNPAERLPPQGHMWVVAPQDLQHSGLPASPWAPRPHLSVPHREPPCPLCSDASRLET